MLDDNDMKHRITKCDTNGHVYNACSPDKHSKTGYWCAYCARPITKEEYEGLVK